MRAENDQLRFASADMVGQHINKIPAVTFYMFNLKAQGGSADILRVQLSTQSPLGKDTTQK